MSKRVIDADAMWASSKLEKCRPESIPEYAWLYGVCDANGNFELTSLKVLHGKAYAIRPYFALEDLQRVLVDFFRNGLLFIWEYRSKTYGHWTGSEKPGRLPPKSQRDHYPKLPVTVPSDLLQKYLDDISTGVDPTSRHCLGNAYIGFGLDLVWNRFGGGREVPMPTQCLGMTPESGTAPGNGSLSETAAAYSILGFEEPIGQPKFQAVWLRHFAMVISGGERWVTNAMERTIQECQRDKIGIPPDFFEAKRDVETREKEEARRQAGAKA